MSIYSGVSDLLAGGRVLGTRTFLQKKVINLDHGVNGGPTKYVMCAWSDCDRDGFETNKVRVRMSAPGQPVTYLQYVFCTERHKMYWVNSTVSNHNLPAGYKLSVV